MEMMNGVASCLIKVRQHHIGFPSLFSHYPEGMKHEELTEIHDYVQNAMDQPREISEASGYLRRVIIGTGKYLVMGISGYAQHLAAEVQNVPHQLVDFTGRGCPGFIGFVWNLETTPVQQIMFPSLSAFGSVFHELILEHWEDSKNSEWAYQTRAGIETPYKYSVSGERLPIPVETVALNHNRRKLYSFNRCKESTLLYQAMSEAVKKQVVSVCTDLYFNDEEGSKFLNMTADIKGTMCEVMDNKKYLQRSMNKESAVTKSNSSDNNMPAQQTAVLPEEPVSGNDYNIDKKRNRLITTIRRATGTDLSRREYSNTVYLVILLDSSPKVIDLASRFINFLATSIRNSHQFEICLCAPDNRAGKFETGIVLPEDYSINEFENLCRRILLHYLDTGEITVDYNGRCWVRTNSGYERFHVFVMEKSAILAKNEILLKGSVSTEKRTTENRGSSKITPKRSDTPKEPISSPTSDPLIELIKQNNSAKQLKKNNSDEDPFKCFN